MVLSPKILHHANHSAWTPCKLFCIKCKLFCIPCTLVCIPFKLFCIPRKLVCIKCKLFCIPSKLFCMKCKLFFIPCKMFCTQCKLFCILCKLFCMDSLVNKESRILPKLSYGIDSVILVTNKSVLHYKQHFSAQHIHVGWARFSFDQFNNISPIGSSSCYPTLSRPGITWPPLMCGGLEISRLNTRINLISLSTANSNLWPVIFWDKLFGFHLYFYFQPVIPCNLRRLSVLD